MQITIHIPLKANIVNGGFVVAVDNVSTGWSKDQLGEYADKSGVYIHHSNGKILYVGTTTVGEWGNFGERLRREFPKTSARNSDLFKLLAAQAAPIRSYLLDLDDIDMMVDPGPILLPKNRKALIMEQALIGIYEPKGNKC